MLFPNTIYVFPTTTMNEQTGFDDVALPSIEICRIEHVNSKFISKNGIETYSNAKVYFPSGSQVEIATKLQFIDDNAEIKYDIKGLEIRKDLGGRLHHYVAYL